MKIVTNKKIFGIIYIIKNQYVIWLVKTLKFITINQVTASDIKTWDIYITYLEYRFLFELSKLAYKIEIKRPALIEICGRNMKICL